MILHPAEGNRPFFFFLQNQEDEVATHPHSGTDNSPVHYALSADFEHKLFSVVPLKHLFMSLHGLFRNWDEGSVAELFYWPQLHEVSGVLAFNRARDTDIYEKTVSCPLKILRIRGEKGFELQGIILYH